MNDVAALEARLREAYPSAVANASNSLGSLVADDTRLYVYRDRNAARQPLPADWWRDETLARTVVDGEGRYLDANVAAARLFGVDRSTIVGSPAGRFTRHEGGDNIGRRLFETLARYGRDRLDGGGRATQWGAGSNRLPHAPPRGRKRVRDGDAPVRPLGDVNDVNATSL